MFSVNGINWNIVFVKPTSTILQRVNGEKTVAVTDWNLKTIFLSDDLYGSFLNKVIYHEICHVYLFSYHIHMDIFQEEILCDILSTYGKDIIELSDNIYKKLRR